jgi:hypothetical protein
MAAPDRACGTPDRLQFVGAQQLAAIKSLDQWSGGAWDRSGVTQTKVRVLSNDYN